MVNDYEITLFDIANQNKNADTRKRQEENRKRRELASRLKKLKEKNKRNINRKQKHIVKNIKENEDKLRKHNKKKSKRMINIFINLIYPYSINLIELKSEKIEIYGEGSYIIYYILRNKIKKYKSLCNVKIIQVNNNGYLQNKIVIPKKELKNIKSILEKANINYTHIISFMNYYKEDEKEFEENKYLKYLKISKKHVNIKRKIEKIKETIEDLTEDELIKLNKYISDKYIEIIQNKL